MENTNKMWPGSLYKYKLIGGSCSADVEISEAWGSSAAQWTSVVSNIGIAGLRLDIFYDFSQEFCAWSPLQSRSLTLVYRGSDKTVFKNSMLFKNHLILWLLHLLRYRIPWLEVTLKPTGGLRTHTHSLYPGQAVSLVPDKHLNWYFPHSLWPLTTASAKQ